MLAFLTSSQGLTFLSPLTPVPVRAVTDLEKGTRVMHGDPFLTEPVNARCDFIPVGVHLSGILFTISFGNSYNTER